MKLRSFLLSVLICCSLAASALTDDQVIAYIKQQTALGKTQQQIGKELLAKGVTPEQAKRIKEAYEAQEGAAQNTPDAAPQNYNDIATARKNMTEVGPDSTLANQSARPQTQGVKIYGHDIFKTNSQIFEPSENLATPQNYRLGPGDEVMIDIWGNSEDHIRQTISPEGSIMIEQIGPVYLNGMTIADANKHIKNVFSKKYAGVSDAETDVQVTLGQVRTILVDIMGEVASPGSMRISPFGTVFNALYRAGGINDIGSLRNIQVLRNGKKVAGVDLYEYIFDGKASGNIRLQEGDVVIVPPYEQVVDITGNVRRPMMYEIKPGETVANILDYAGGFDGNAYSDIINLSRKNGQENQMFNISKADFANYKLKDGDMIKVGTVIDRYANRVELDGAVFRPGMYALSSDLSTVKQLIQKAEGLKEDAYTQRALLYREGPDLRLEVISLDLGAIMSGNAKDVRLKRNDVLVVSSIFDIKDLGDFTITGQVAFPGNYSYVENFTVEDLILRAGGLLDGASTAKVNIYRRLIDPTATDQTQQLSQSLTISIENGLAVGDNKGLVLQPYDMVVVRKSPGYSTQQMVTLDGEVLFTGQYAIVQRNERLSSFVQRAGGLIDGAYIKGAQLTRKLSEAEMRAREETLALAKSQSGAGGSDSIALSKIQIADHYSVGIDLEKALQFPGSTYDLVLKDGDHLYVPEQQSVVKIAGDVMFPNSVVYVPGKKLKYYIDQAGGYGQRAKKCKAFVVYMNGSVARAKGNTPIEPGCQIIVPSKPESSGTDWTKIMTLVTGFTSVATMAATVTNLFK